MMDNKIRIRACVAAVKDGKILLVPRYDTDAGKVQWNLPGGAVESTVKGYGKQPEESSRKKPDWMSRFEMCLRLTRWSYRNVHITV